MITIREATKQDLGTVYELIKEAFKTAMVSDGTEQDFANDLRGKQCYLPNLELVAEQEGNIVGHIMFTKLLVNIEKESLTALLVAPLCVKLEERNKKIGCMLMNKGLKIAEKMGYTAVFLVGNPDYYERFGFKQTYLYGIKNDSEIPDQFVLAREIMPGSLMGKTGSVSIH